MPEHELFPELREDVEAARQRLANAPPDQKERALREIELRLNRYTAAYVGQDKPSLMIVESPLPVNSPRPTDASWIKVLARLHRFISSFRKRWYRLLLTGYRVQLAGSVHVDGPVFDRIQPYGTVSLGENVSIGKGVLLIVAQSAMLTIGANVNIQAGTEIVLGEGANLTIGEGTLIVSQSRIYCEGASSIGRECLIASFSILADVNHRFDRTDIPISQQGNTTPEPFHIGDGCWLGTKSTVLPGVTMGEGAILAANAVLSKNAEANGIYGGIPAKLLKMRF